MSGLASGKLFVVSPIRESMPTQFFVVKELQSFDGVQGTHCNYLTQWLQKSCSPVSRQNLEGLIHQSLQVSNLAPFIKFKLLQMLLGAGDVIIVKISCRPVYRWSKSWSRNPLPCSFPPQSLPAHPWPNNCFLKTGLTPPRRHLWILMVSLPLSSSPCQEKADISKDGGQSFSWKSGRASSQCQDCLLGLHLLNFNCWDICPITLLVHSHSE